MNIALTGATGFIGRYIVRELAGQGHHLKCWYRESSNRDGLDAFSDSIDWLPGQLADPKATDTWSKTSML